MEAVKLFLLLAVIFDNTNSLLTSQKRCINMSRWGWGQITMAASDHSRRAPSEPNRGSGGARPPPSPSGVPGVISTRWSTPRHDNQPFYDVLRSLTAIDQLVVVLVGLPGCGKSTLAFEIATNSSRRWGVVCQDVLGSRQKVWNAGQVALEHGDNLIVDRCNFDATQREHWIRLAAEVEYNMRSRQEDLSNSSSSYHLKRIVPVSVVLPNSNNVSFCADRATRRGNDGVHVADTDWVTVCKRMSRSFSMPSTVEEAFAAVYRCSTQEDVHTLINLLASVNSGGRR